MSRSALEVESHYKLWEKIQKGIGETNASFKSETFPQRGCNFQDLWNGDCSYYPEQFFDSLEVDYNQIKET